MQSSSIKRELVFSFIFLLIIASLGVVLASITVSTDKSSYTPGSVVVISGTTSPNTPVGIQVKSPSGSTVWIDSVTSDSSGRFSSSFTLRSDAELGTYTVYASTSSGTATCTFAVTSPPSPPPPPPTPPPPVNYEPLARSQIMSDKDALAALNSTVRTLQTLLAQLNQTLSTDYLKQLSQIAQQIQAAENLYSQGQYEQAYNTATAASDALSKLATSLARETISILGTTANTLYARTTDPTVRDLLQAVISTLSSLSPYDTQVFDRLFFIARTLAVVAKTLNIPALQSSLSSLSTQLQNLQSRLTSLNQTKAQLEQQVATLQQQNQNLQQQVSSLQTQVNSLQSQISQLQQQLSTLQTENANLKAQLEQTMPTTTAIAAAILALIAGLAIGVILSRLRRKA